MSSPAALLKRIALVEMANLPGKEAYELFDVDGFTHKEIAEILDIDVSNVKVRLHRARKKMRIILNENCKFERDDRNVFVCIPNEECDQSGPTNKHGMVHEPSSSRKYYII